MNRSEKSNRWGILIAVLILYLLPFYYAKLFAWPCAEDYCYTFHLNGFSFKQLLQDAWNCYFVSGGRYFSFGNGQSWQWLMFHPAAYGGYCIFTGIIAFIPVLGIMLELGRHKSFRENLFWALLFFAAAYSSMGGLAQIFYWVANIFSSTLSLVFLLYGIWAICHLWNCKKFSYVAFIAAMLAAFIAPGFYEHAAIAQFYVAVTTLLCAWWFKRYRTAFTILAVWSIIWVSAVMLAPGNFQRQVTHQAAVSATEALFMGSRGLAGILLYTILSPWLFILPAFISGYVICGYSISSVLNLRRRLLLCLVATGALLTIVALHVMTRYPIVFDGRTGSSLLVISWIVFIWASIVFSNWLNPALAKLWITPHLPVIAVIALFFTGNTFRLWQSIASGDLRLYANEMQQRHDIYRAGKGRDIAVSPLSSRAWPAQKLCLGDLSYDADGGYNPWVTNSFELHSLRLTPGIPEVKDFMRQHPEKLSCSLQSIPLSGVEAVKICLVKGIPVTNNCEQDWLQFHVTGNQQELEAFRYLRIIVMTDKCISPVLNYFATKQAFPRLSAAMIAAVYGSCQNHVCFDLQGSGMAIERVNSGQGKQIMTLLVPVNKSPAETTMLIFYSLDTRTYFKGYQK